MRAGVAVRRPALHSLVSLLGACTFSPTWVEGEGVDGDSDGPTADAPCPWDYTPTGFTECPLAFAGALAITMPGEHRLDLTTGRLTAPDDSTTTLVLGSAYEETASLLAVGGLHIGAGAVLRVRG